MSTFHISQARTAVKSKAVTEFRYLTLSCSFLQVPSEVLCSAFSHLGLLDRASFRLTCKCWRQISQHDEARVHFLQSNCWEASAHHLRQICPHAKVVLNIDGDGDLETWKHISLCDLVSVAPQPEVMPVWTFEPRWWLSGKSKQALQRLQKAQQQLKTYSDVTQLEFILHLRSDHTSLPKMQAAISSLRHAIGHLRVRESLLECANNIFPLANLHTLGFTLPFRFDLLERIQVAIQSLPKLTAMHVYTTTAKATSLIPYLLRCLRTLDRLTLLRVVTGGHAKCLPAFCLLHLTALELGQQVTVDMAVSKLAHLRVQEAHHEFEPGNIMLQQLSSGNMTNSLAIDCFTPEALLQLPACLQVLTLSQLFEDIQLDSIGAALNRLFNLKVLRIYNFLTDPIVAMLSMVHLPRLQTLGFHMHPIFSNKSPHQDKYVSRSEGMLLYVPSVKVSLLPAALPSLQLFEVFCVSARRMAVGALHCGVMTDASFSHLRGITGHCARFDLRLMNVPASCYAVIKAFADH